MMLPPHIYGGVHSLNLSWGLSWMWEEGAPFLRAPEVLKNFPTLILYIIPMGIVS